MKWKNILFTVVLNIFIMLLVTVLIEYNGLSQRMQEACDNIRLAFDTAIESSTATEELFSVNNRVSNSTVQQTSYSSNGTANTLVWSNSSTGGSWYNGNNYVLSWFYWKNKRFPTQGEYNTVASTWSPYKIWSWLYGGVVGSSSMEDEWASDVHTGLGQSYTQYPWACRNTQTKSIYSNHLIGLPLGTTNDARRPSREFEAFFKEIGKKVKSNYTFKREDTSTGRFTVEQHDVPTLLKMGLHFPLPEYSKYTDSTNATLINDDMISTVKLGKRRNNANGVNSYAQSVYFYSPYTLGVTYVPVSVLKPMFLYNLDSIVRLGVASSSGFSPSTPTSNVDFNQSSGCLGTNVYADLSSGVSEVHKESGTVVPYQSGNGIINDGQVEYDLRSAKVRVDYFYIDIHNNSFYNTASELYGALPAKNSAGHQEIYPSAIDQVPATGSTIMTNIGELIMDNETGGALANKVDGNMIVAKCTVRIKLHITYESYMLQWMCYKDHSATDNNHYDIKLYNPVLGSIKQDSDGVWYEYSKYYGYTR